MKLAKHGFRGSATRLFLFMGLQILLAGAFTAPGQAAPGDLIAHVPLSVPGYGVSVAVACDPALIYYTLYDVNSIGDGMLHAMSKTGVDFGVVPITDPAGNLLFIDEIAYDELNNILWGVEHNTSPIRVWKIDRATGNAVMAFLSSTNSIGSYRDGITVDTNDGTLWLSADVSNTVDHYTLAGGYLGSITPTDAGGAVLGSISGIQVGIGDLMYLGRNGAGQIVRVKKSDGTFIGSFASPGGRDEGLECDPVSFSPLTVIWSRDYPSPGFVDAIEVEPGTCRCGGVTPTNRSTWGQLKSIYR